MIEKGCDDWKRLQKKFALVIGWIFSSNINEGIKAVLFFLRKDFARTKKHRKIQKAQNVNKRLSLRCFLYP